MKNSDSLLQLLSVDRWRQRCGVEDILRRLIVDLTDVRPDDVMAFIHQWSAPHSVGTDMRQEHNENRKRRQRHQSHPDPHTMGSREQDHSLEESSKLETRAQEEDEQYDPRQECNSGSKWVREEKPTVQELQSLYLDAKNSPYEFLLGEGDYAAHFERDGSISLSTNSLGICLGRGNYGFVVPAIPKSSLSEEFNKSIGSGFTDEEILRAIEKGRVVAIKVNRVQAIWSLDEVNSLHRVTVSRQHLEHEFQRLQEQIEAHGVSEEGGAVQQHQFPQQQEQQQRLEGNRDDEDEGQQQAALPTEHVNIHDLEVRLQIQGTFLQGARHVNRLVGDVMYDTQRDALLFPLEFYPSSLGECIRARRRRCIGSLPTQNPFPDVVLNDRGESAMALLFSVQEMQHVVRSLCQALHFLHSICGLCHLDIKADNILLSHTWLSDQSNVTPVVPPHVVLGDLGLAQPIGAPILQLGDFTTMAPEVYWAEMHDEAKYAPYRTAVFSATSDIWAVGCVLLQMANGLDYTAWPPADMFAALEANFIAPAARHPQVWPMILNDFAARCFERDPRRRMNAAAALQHPFLAGP
ncbi:Protein kinase domain [Trypanosoma melophagium]|uniref:Protein kinase domain n=1 Tax=Trypanosoma melophagium TaxID=715481 RepID=UPI00351A85B5|nr:Protein kinase domain [Trypanosoma melophagium]